MNEQLLVSLVELVMAGALFIGLIVVIAAGAFDIRLATRRRRTAWFERRLVRSRQPHVTVIIFTEPGVPLAPCIAAVRRSRYYHYDIVVADNRTNATTKNEVRSIQQARPTLLLRSFCKRKPADAHTVASQAYARSARGEFVMVLRASEHVRPATIKRAVAALQAAAREVVVYCGVLHAQPESVVHAYAQLLGFGSATWQKATWLIKRKSRHVNRPFVCKSGALTRMQAAPAIYDPLVTVEAMPRDERATVLRLLQPGRAANLALIPTAISYLLIFSYSTYAAATLKSASLLMVGWAGVTIWYGAATWASDVRGKAVAFALAPLMYVLLALHMSAWILLTLHHWYNRVATRLIRIVSEPMARFLLRHS